MGHGELRVRELSQSKAHPRLRNVSLSIQSFALSDAVKLELYCQIMPPPQFDPPFGSLKWPQGVENSTNRNVVPDCYTYHRHILHRLAIIHNEADQQSDQNKLMQ